MVGVVPDPADPAWVGEAVLALVRAAAERRRPAFLLDLAPEASDLASRFGAVGSEGIAEAVAGEARLPEVAHRDEEHGVAYLPCGLGAPGDELAGSAALAAFAERVRGEEGVLLVLLDREAAAAVSAGWPDGWVLLGEAEAATGGGSLPDDLPELAHIEPRGESPGAEAGRWRRHREGASFPTMKATVAALFLAATAAAWWWYADRVTAGDAGSPLPDVEAPARSGSDAAPGVGPAREDSARDRTLAFSVLIASYASAEAARERVRELSERAEGVFFVSPTPVRGSVWHRVYAGARADREAAEALMERLVEAGAKGEARAWDVRPVPWSFRVDGGLGARAAAADRAESLGRRGVPAYLLSSREGGDTVYRVYSGAFESRGAAGALGERIEEAGVEAELVRRAGAPR